MVESVSSSYLLMSEDRKSPFLSVEKTSKSPFLTEEQLRDKKRTSFLSEDKIPKDSPEPFLSNDITADRPNSFLQTEDTSKTKSPLEIVQNSEDANKEAAKVNTYKFPKDTGTILAELKRNPMHSTITARNIADDFGISYARALDIFKLLNADANGIAREFNLPDENATVSFLV